MKKLSLRMLACLVALLLIVGLTACGGNGGESSSIPDNSVSTLPTDPNATTDPYATTDPSASTAPSATVDPSASTAPSVTGPTASIPSQPSQTQPSQTQPSQQGPQVTQPSQTQPSQQGPVVTQPTQPGQPTQTTQPTQPSASQNTTTSQGPETNLSWAQVKAMIPASARGTELVIYDWNPITEVPGLSDVNKNFTAETGIKIKYTIVTYNDYFTKISSMVAAKNAPDAVRLQNITRSNLINLQPFNKCTDYNFNDKAWDKEILDLYTFNGNLYGVNMEGSPFFSPVMIYYNKDIIANLDLDDPYQLWKSGNWTWDALWDLGKSFMKTATADQKFSAMYTMAYCEYNLAYGTLPVAFNKQTKQFTSNFKNSTFVTSMQNHVKYFTAGYVRNIDNDAMNAGELLFAACHGIAARKGSSYFAKIRAQGKIGCVPLPALRKGMTDYQLISEPQAFGIPKTAKNPKLVPYYLRYYFDVKNYNMNDFYNVDHAAESIAYIQSKDCSISAWSAIVNMNYTGMDNSVVLTDLWYGGEANVKQYLDTMAPAVDAAIVEANKFYASL